MADEKVMSQADIDALVAKVPPKPNAHRPAPVASAPKPPPPPPKPPVAEKPPAVAPTAPPAPPPVPREGTPKYEKYSSGEVGSLQNTVADLARQVGKMTNVMQKLDSMEEKINMIFSLLKLEPDATQSLGGRLDEIYARLEAMKGADIQGEFVCAHCKTRQMMAVHVKCTSCGEETWMGWWPEGNHK